MEKKGQVRKMLRRNWFPDFQAGGAPVLSERINNALGRKEQTRGLKKAD